MTKTRYHLINGEIQAENKLPDLAADWLKEAGSSLSINWRASGTRIPFYSKQYYKLYQFLTALGICSEIIPSASRLETKLIQLIQKNRFFKGVDLKIIVRLLISDNSKKLLNYLVIPSEHSEENFQLNKKGLMMGIIPGGYHPGRELLPYLEPHHPIRQKWLSQASENSFDTICLLSPEGKLIETPNSNIFLLRASKIYTPDLAVGVTPNAIREEILSISEYLAFQAVQTSALEPAHLKQADEVFLADDYNGIRWVLGFENKRYYKKHCQQIIAKINSDWQATD
jgi:hypothetical protein